MLECLSKLHTNFYQQNESRLLSSFRQKNLKRLIEEGLPIKSQESWRYTPIKLLKELQVGPTSTVASSAGSVSTIETILKNQIDTYRMGEVFLFTFLNGKYSADLSDKVSDASFSITSLKEAAKTRTEEILNLVESLPKASRDDAGFLKNLNSAFLQEGLLIEIKKRSVEVSKPIQILNFSNSAEAVSLLNVFLKTDEASRVQILSTTILTKPSFASIRTFGDLAENSSVEFYRYSNLVDGSTEMSLSDFSLKRDAHINHINLTSGGALNRHQLNVYLEGDGAAISLSGFTTLKKSEVTDNQLNVEHKVPNTTSKQHYKAILSDSSKSVFAGRIHIYENAVGTSADQLNKNIILSKQAEVDTKPQLEVFADDVKATHGAAIGRLDVDELFYLESRGIPRQESLAMLAYAFVDDVLLGVKDLKIRNSLREKTIADFSLLKVEDLYDI